MLKATSRNCEIEQTAQNDKNVLLINAAEGGGGRVGAGPSGT